MRIAAITQCYQEDVMLPVWTAYYSRLVGAGNLRVIDHGSEPPVSIADVAVTTVPRTAFDDEEKVANLSTWQDRFLQEGYDWVICCDTDEFVVLRPDAAVDLKDYLATCERGVRRCVGVEVIDPGTAPALAWDRPILRQRPSGIITKWSCKPLVSSVRTTWTAGLHDSREESVFDHNLWMFHLKYADETHLMERLAFTRALAWSERALKAGHGGSHRVPDFAMKHHLQGYRGRRAVGTLDRYLAETENPETVDSPLLDIPEIFLDTL